VVCEPEQTGPGANDDTAADARTIPLMVIQLETDRIGSLCEEWTLGVN
jgi:hypothetical protein